MTIRWWPRSIRGQMLAGVVLLEALSVVLFAVLLTRQQAQDVHRRAQQRMAHHATSMALEVREDLLQQKSAAVAQLVKMMADAPDVSIAKISDPAGSVLFASEGEGRGIPLTPLERAQIPLLRGEEPRVFSLDGDHWEGVNAIYVNGVLRGYAWVETDLDWDHAPLSTVLRGTLLFGIIWIGASALLVLWLASSISRPLATLRRGTRALMSSPESGGNFPLPVAVHNEIGDLIEAFNGMAASLEEQRQGLNNTLSLLDSMLANAPIGLAFFDRSCRFVRVNQVFAGMTGVPLDRHLGRSLPELMPQPLAQQFEDAVLCVFAHEEPVRDLELNCPSGKPNQPHTWLASAYPVRPTARQVRWVGVIVLDASARKRSEEALRRTEKLAATGRLAASIAHEINNPLEAITNLLFLLRNFCNLQDPALNYVSMAEHEAHRISEITQQTLRFYRQSTLPTRADMAELLDSVLGLYQGKLNGLDIHVVKDYDPQMELFCFAGEVRQVFANLVGNAIDASSAGGQLAVRARPSRNWKNPEQKGVRFTIADSGAGMEPAVRERIFEAFFTTKEVTGTGLGLWVSHEIIGKHRGTVRVRSRAATGGKTSGTVFQLFLPDNPMLTAAPSQAAVIAT